MTEHRPTPIATLSNPSSSARELGDRFPVAWPDERPPIDRYHRSLEWQQLTRGARVTFNHVYGMTRPHRPSAWPSRATLAELGGYDSRRTITRHFAELERAGLIQRCPQTRAYGWESVQLIELTLSPSMLRSADPRKETARPQIDPRKQALSAPPMSTRGGHPRPPLRSKLESGSSQSTPPSPRKRGDLSEALIDLLMPAVVATHESSPGWLEQTAEHGYTLEQARALLERYPSEHRDGFLSSTVWTGTRRVRTWAAAVQAAAQALLSRMQNSDEPSDRVLTAEGDLGADVALSGRSGSVPEVPLDMEHGHSCSVALGGESDPEAVSSQTLERAELSTLGALPDDSVDLGPAEPAADVSPPVDSREQGRRAPLELPRIMEPARQEPDRADHHIGPHREPHDDPRAALVSLAAPEVECDLSEPGALDVAHSQLHQFRAPEAPKPPYRKHCRIPAFYQTILSIWSRRSEAEHCAELGELEGAPAGARRGSELPPDLGDQPPHAGGVRGGDAPPVSVADGRDVNAHGGSRDASRREVREVSAHLRHGGRVWIEHASCHAPLKEGAIGA